MNCHIFLNGDRRGLKSTSTLNQSRLKPVGLRTLFSGLSSEVAQEFIPGQWFPDRSEFWGNSWAAAVSYPIFLTRTGGS